MRLSSKGELFKTRALKLKTIAKISIAEVIAKTAFILAIIIDIKVVEIKASFLTFEVINI